MSGVVDYIKSVFRSPSPSLAGCSEPQEDNTPKVVAKPGEELITLNRLEIGQVMLRLNPGFDECAVNKQEASGNQNAQIADFLVNEKFRSAHLTGTDGAIRDNLAKLTTEQKAELVTKLTAVLVNASGQYLPLFSNLSVAEQSRVNKICQPGAPKGYNPDAPLNGVSKQSLLKLIGELKPAEEKGMKCGGEGVIKCWEAIPARQEAIIPILPFANVAVAPETIKRNPKKDAESKDITLNGTLLGIVDKEGKLIKEFSIAIDDANITVTPGTPVVAKNGLVTSLPVNLAIKKEAAEGDKKLTIKYTDKAGEVILQELTMKIKNVGGGGGGAGKAVEGDKTPRTDI